MPVSWGFRTDVLTLWQRFARYAQCRILSEVYESSIGYLSPAVKSLFYTVFVRDPGRMTWRRATSLSAYHVVSAMVVSLVCCIGRAAARFSSSDARLRCSSGRQGVHGGRTG